MLTDNDQQHSYVRQKRDVEGAAQSHAGKDEGNNEDEEADDHQSSHCLGPSWGPTQKCKLVKDHFRIQYTEFKAISCSHSCFMKVVKTGFQCNAGDQQIYMQGFFLKFCFW